MKDLTTWSVEEAGRLLEVLAIQTKYLRDHLSTDPERRAAELRALGAAVRDVPGIDPDGSLLSFVTAEIKRMASRLPQSPPIV
jgi:hypothetical protein